MHRPAYDFGAVLQIISGKDCWPTARRHVSWGAELGAARAGFAEGGESRQLRGVRYSIVGC